MQCMSIEKIYQYLDGELSKREEKEVKAHLLVCKQCYSRAKRLEFESAIVAKALRSEILSKDERERTIKKLAQKRDWPLEESLTFKYRPFLVLSQKISLILVFVLGLSVVSYSILMKDISVHIFVSSLSNFFTSFSRETFLSSASQVICIANSLTGGLIPAKIAIVLFILYGYSVFLVLLIWCMSIPKFKINGKHIQ